MRAQCKRYGTTNVPPIYIRTKKKERNIKKRIRENYLSGKLVRRARDTLGHGSGLTIVRPIFRPSRVELNVGIFFSRGEIYPRDVSSIGVFVPVYTVFPGRGKDTPKYIIRGKRFHPLISEASSSLLLLLLLLSSPTAKQGSVETAATTSLNFTADTSSVQINNAPYLL